MKLDDTMVLNPRFATVVADHLHARTGDPMYKAFNAYFGTDLSRQGVNGVLRMGFSHRFAWHHYDKLVAVKDAILREQAGMQ